MNIKNKISGRPITNKNRLNRFVFADRLKKKDTEHTQIDENGFSAIPTSGRTLMVAQIVG